MTEPNSGKLIAVIGLGNMGSATGDSRPAAQEPVEHVEEFG
jgi:predicted dinucleotide-binding enzyme